MSASNMKSTLYNGYSGTQTITNFSHPSVAYQVDKILDEETFIEGGITSEHKQGHKES